MMTGGTPYDLGNLQISTLSLFQELRGRRKHLQQLQQKLLEAQAQQQQLDSSSGGVQSYRKNMGLSFATPMKNMFYPMKHMGVSFVGFYPNFGILQGFFMG
jgi:hypothetical protein